MPEKHCLNLSERYAASWGEWEVAREIVTNALDAEPSPFIEFPSDDELVVRTKAAPRLAHLLVMGSGTKSANGETIGQFGEGFKLAALACTRAGGTLTARTPNGVFNFRLEETALTESERVLHALYDPSQKAEGCEIYINLPNIRSACAGRFLLISCPDDYSKTIPVPKRTHGLCRIYCRGVFVSETSESSIWDWNIASTAINRDRNVMSEWTIRAEAAGYLVHHWNEETIDAILEKPGAREVEWLKHYAPRIRLDDDAVSLTLSRVIAHYGEKAVVLTTGTLEEVADAAAAGFHVVECPQVIREVLGDQIPTVRSRTRTRIEGVERSPIHPIPSHLSGLPEAYRSIASCLGLSTRISLFDAVEPAIISDQNGLQVHVSFAEDFARGDAVNPLMNVIEAAARHIQSRHLEYQSLPLNSALARIAARIHLSHQS